MVSSYRSLVGLLIFSSVSHWRQLNQIQLLISDLWVKRNFFWDEVGWNALSVGPFPTPFYVLGLRFFVVRSFLFVDYFPENTLWTALIGNFNHHFRVFDDDHCFRAVNFIWLGIVFSSYNRQLGLQVIWGWLSLIWRVFWELIFFCRLDEGGKFIFCKKLVILVIRSG